MFEYDDIHEHLIYPNNTLIKQNGRLRKTIYVVLNDGIAHGFSNCETFRNMQYDVADALVVNDEEFQRIGEGVRIPNMFHIFVQTNKLNSNEAITSTDEWFYLFSLMILDYVKIFENFCEAK